MSDSSNYRRLILIGKCHKPKQSGVAIGFMRNRWLTVPVSSAVEYQGFMGLDDDNEGNHLVLGDDYDGGPAANDPWPDGTGLPALRTMITGAVMWAACVYGGDYIIRLLPDNGADGEVFKYAVNVLIMIISFIGAVVACVGAGMLIGNLVKKFWKPRKKKRYI